MQWGKRGEASVLFGGQFGSEGKGLAAAWLAENAANQIAVATTNAGAQAGHTTCYKDAARTHGLGNKFVCFHLPTTGVVHRAAALSYINAGSIIDVPAFLAELQATCVHRVMIHPHAAVIAPEDRAAEKAAGSSVSRIASTQKGVGSAISNKIMRRGRLAGETPELMPYVGTLDLNQIMGDWKSVVVEAPQGFDLSLNHGLRYPFTTSRDCWVGSALSDAGIHPSLVGEICAVVRTFPIRVGHLTDEFGNRLGDSGPFYPDSRELDWATDMPGIEPERTTVTKRIRRIATWSDQQYENMLRMNRPTLVFLNFCNYLRGARSFIQQIDRMAAIERRVGLQVNRIYGFGPNVEDVVQFETTAARWFDDRSF